jgi:hypothetical protein
MSIELKIKFHRLLYALGRYIRKYKISNHRMIELYLLRRTIENWLSQENCNFFECLFLRLIIVIAIC